MESERRATAARRWIHGRAVTPRAAPSVRAVESRLDAIKARAYQAGRETRLDAIKAGGADQAGRDQVEIRLDDARRRRVASRALEQAFDDAVRAFFARRRARAALRAALRAARVAARVAGRSATTCPAYVQSTSESEREDAGVCWAVTSSSASESEAD